MSTELNAYTPQRHSTLRRESLSELSHAHERITALEKEVTNLKAQVALILRLEEHYVEDYGYMLVWPHRPSWPDDQKRLEALINE